MASNADGNIWLLLDILRQVQTFHARNKFATLCFPLILNNELL